jgi:cytochrome P450
MTTEIAYEPFGVGGLDFDVYQQLLAHEGVYRSESGFFVPARYEELRAVMGRPKVFSSRPNQSEAMGMTTDGDPAATDAIRQRMVALTEGLPVTAEDLMTSRMIVAADPPRHTHLRNVVNRAFLARQMDKWRDFVQQRVDEMLIGVDGTQPFDVVERLCVPLPVSVIGRILCLEPEEYPKIKRWSGDIINGAQGADRGTEAAATRLFSAFGEFVARFAPEIEVRRTQPRDDIISVLVQKQEEAELSTADALFFLLILMGAGNETTTNLIGNMVVSLYENPDQLDLLLADPSLLPNAIEETLRYRGPVQIVFRQANEDTTIGDTPIPKNSLVAGLMGAANLDPRIFEDPLTYDISRANARANVSFGYGIHFCVGAALARLEAQTAMQALLPLMAKMKLGSPPARVESQILIGYESIELVPA